ncbi:MAG: glycosyltransferase family 4 protein [Pseudomonadota bacterium]
MPEEGSGEKTHNFFMSQAFNKINSKMVSFEPAGYSVKSEVSINNKRGFYRKLKKIMPKILTDWMRDLYCVLYDLKYDKKILDIIDSEKPNFIFERITSYHDSGLRAAKQAGIPFVVEIHEMHNALEYKDRMNFEWYRKYLWIKVARNADLVVVVSTMLKEYLVKEGVDSETIIVLPNAADLELFQVKNKRAAIRNELGFNSEVILGFVGCMHAYHGMDMLPELCRLLLDKNINFKIMLVGSFDRWPGGEQGFRDSLVKSGVEDYFVLIGGVPVTDVPAYIEAMDIGLMPDSNEYGSPLKIFEYGAMAKPVVVPGYGPVTDVIEHAVNGLIFEPKSIVSMALQIELLISDNKLGLELGEHLLADVKRQHTWEKNAISIIESLKKNTELR